ncbi:hypothetical protein NEPAR08_1949 [Nematocida parisii]|nr:hypothetical protein NEPAR03_0593 [Nematocida parisii]KAI5130265.1 hypothetical protein NEPAR08_1949 [Nematocida parisii]
MIMCIELKEIDKCTEMDNSQKEEELFGIPLSEYINTKTDDLSDNSPKKEYSIEDNIQNIQTEQASVERKIREILEKVGKKFSSLAIDVQRCTKLDIEGIDMVDEVKSLREYWKVKETNAIALLRLKTSKISEDLLKVLTKVDKTCALLHTWTERAREAMKEVEKTIIERKTISEVYTGDHIAQRYKSFVEKAHPLLGVLEEGERLVEENSHIYTEKEKEELLLSESFIKVSTQEEKTIKHLVSRIP